MIINIKEKLAKIDFQIHNLKQKKLKIENGFFQSLDSSDEIFIPIWDLKNV